MNLDVRKGQVRSQYDAIAPSFDAMERIPSLLGGLPWLRRELLARAWGRVLEVAIGTGASLDAYPPECEITGADLSEGMLAKARERAAALGRKVELAVMDVEALPAADGSFDTVVSCLSLCTFPDPIRALHEMARVCRPDGRILLFEHGRSSVGWMGRWQDRRAASHAEHLGCEWNREPLELAHAAGLDVRFAERRRFGIIHLIEAAGAGR